MRRHPHRYHARLLLASSLLACATAHAQTKSAEEAPQPAPAREAESRAAAEALFRRGKAVYSAGKLLEAYEVYKAAWSLRKTYEIAGNLGNVALELGKAREAAEYLAYSRSMFPANGSPEKLARLEAALVEARRQVATVRVEVRRQGEASEGAAGEAEVLGDGQLAGRAPLGQELFLDPGYYTLKARLAGYADGERSIHVEKGSVETVILTLEAISIPEGRRGARNERAPPKVAGAPSPEWRLPVIVAGLGVAAAGLGVGIGAAVHSGARRADVNEAWVGLYDAAGDSACYGGGGALRASCDELLAAESDARTFRTLSIVGFIAGGAGAVTSIALLFLTGASSPSGAQGQSAVAFSLGFAPSAGVASVRGSF